MGKNAHSAVVQNFLIALSNVSLFSSTYSIFHIYVVAMFSTCISHYCHYYYLSLSLLCTLLLPLVLHKCNEMTAFITKSIKIIICLKLPFYALVYSLHLLNRKNLAFFMLDHQDIYLCLKGKSANELNLINFHGDILVILIQLKP